MINILRLLLLIFIGGAVGVFIAAMFMLVAGLTSRTSMAPALRLRDVQEAMFIGALYLGPMFGLIGAAIGGLFGISFWSRRDW